MWFKKDKFVLVKTIPLKVYFETPTEEYTMCFYLYETIKNERKIEVKCKHPAGPNYFGIDEYSMKIYPWLMGQNFDDIPTYFDLKKSKSKRYIKLLYKRILG